MFTLPELPYAYNALEPVIDEKTMTIHHTKHHQWYTDKLNKAIEWTSYEGQTIEEILSEWTNLPDGIRNNGWGYHNHILFWESMTPWGSEISSVFESKLTEAFGSVKEFKNAFEQSAGSRFGSGWARLVDDTGTLKVTSTANQDSPLMFGMTPLLWLDVWEHAYYLNYQNRRGEYVSKFWDVVNWEAVEKRIS